MSEREPLRAQYSNVLSVSAKLCLQIANHHAFQSIHTCIIMHHIFSCILIKLLCYSYTPAFSIPMLTSVKINLVNFKFILSCQFQNPTVSPTSKFSGPFKFKLMQSCQVNFNLFLQYNSFLSSVKWLVHIQEQLVPVKFVSVIGQVASSHPRTACTCQICLCYRSSG